MPVTNYLTETAIDPTTGRALVTVTAYGAQSQPYQWQWLSDAMAPSGAAGVSSPGAVPLSNVAVSAEVAIAAPSLVGSASARTINPGLTRIAKPRR